MRSTCTRATIISLLFLSLPFNLESRPSSDGKQPVQGLTYWVFVYDMDTKVPLQLARVGLRSGATAISTQVTGADGKTAFRDVDPGSYVVSVHLLGYSNFSTSIIIDNEHLQDSVALKETAIEQAGVVVTGTAVANVSSTVDVKSGNQVLEGETYHPAPTSQATSLIQENLAGAVRAPTGEVHVRGMHGEYTYYIDGVPIPLGVFGGLNDIVDSRVVDRATFYTGGFPAEYGGQMAAVIDMQTRVPSGRFHVDLSTYGGSYLTSGGSLGDRVGAFNALNSNGQSISLSDRRGDFGFFLSGTRQETDRRMDQPVESLFHDHGFNYFLYGKTYYLISDNDYLTTNLSYSETQTEIPFDSLEGFQWDNQNTFDAFQTLSYFHKISNMEDHESNFFAGLYAREGGFHYFPSVEDDNKQFLGDDTTTGYVVGQHRTFATFGIRTKYDRRLSHQFGYAIGLNYSNTSGTEDFAFQSALGPGPGINNDFNGYDLGLFAQANWHPLEWTGIDVGLRYDQHSAPDVPSQNQLSPRIKWNFFPDEFNTISLYYGRLFMPINIEGLRSLASQIGGSNTGTLPERDNLFELSYMRNWSFNLSSKMAIYYKEATPGLDDETLGSSSVKTPIDIDVVKITGIEVALTYTNPSSPFSGYANAALIHAYGRGPISGGFLPADSSTDVFDNDHDQRLSVVVGLNYQTPGYFLTLTGIYGSGLTNGNTDYEFKTGLFDFNQGAHTTPSWVFNLSTGYTIPLSGGSSIQPSIFITNLLDHPHLLKGAFFSGASFEERRSLVFKIAYHL